MTITVGMLSWWRLPLGVATFVLTICQDWRTALVLALAQIIIGIGIEVILRLHLEMFLRR